MKVVELIALLANKDYIDKEVKFRPNVGDDELIDGLIDYNDEVVILG